MTSFSTYDRIVTICSQLVALKLKTMHPSSGNVQTQSRFKGMYSWHFTANYLKHVNKFHKLNAHTLFREALYNISQLQIYS